MQTAHKKILITGSSGYVGKSLIEFLWESFEIDVLSRSQNKLNHINNSFLWGDLPDILVQYDAVIHLAGLAHDTKNRNEEKKYFYVNEGLTKKIVDWINKTQVKSCKLIYLSSIKSYTECLKIDENTQQKPSSIYGKSKLAAEKYIKENLNLNHKYYILQPTMIYGKGCKGNLPRLCSLLLKGIPYPFSKWENKKSILYMGNLTYVINRLLNDKINSNSFIVSDDELTSTIEMIEKIFNVRDENIFFINLPKQIITMLVNLSLIIGFDSLSKLLGDMVVSNSKLKETLEISSMPHSTQEGLRNFGRTI